MEANIITNVLLPVALGIIVLGLGLTLTVADFTRVVRYPKAAIIGLTVQIAVLPAAAFFLCLAFKLPPELAVGLMLLAASPGGATANIYSHLAHGDVALNITLTAINSVLCLLTLPFIVNSSLAHFMGAQGYVPPPVQKIIEVGVIILAPVLAGMLIRAKAAAFADRLGKPVKILSILVLVGLVVASIIKEWDLMMTSFATVGLACLAFNLLSMGAGYAAPMLFKLPEKQSVAIAMEIGIHNGTLAIFIALNVLKSPPMSVPAAVYSIIMFVTAALFGWWVSRHLRA